MKALLWLVAVLLLAVAAPFPAAAGNDHLEPPGWNWWPSVVRNYYVNVFPLLHADFSAQRQACFTVLPAFAPEYAWSLESGGPGGPFLLVNSLTHNFWYTRSTESTVRRIPISPRLHKAVRNVFLAAASQIHKPVEERHVLDGVVYIFSLVGEDGVPRAGLSHSPASGSLMGRLVALCEALAGPHGDSWSEASFEAEIQALIREME